MSAKYFLDTNIFVYSFDQDQPAKKEKSLALIGKALQSNDGLISTQVIQEFMNVATRKFRIPMKFDDCKTYLQKVLHPLCQVFPDLVLYEESLEIQKETGYSFYDSLILAGALRGGCTILFSEDFQHAHQIKSMKIVNPFLL